MGSALRNPGRLALGCVAENRPKFLLESLRLLQSLRWFGGKAADADFFFCCVDDLDPDYAQEVRRLGGQIRIVRRFSSWHGHSNKLQFLNLPDLQGYDTVVLLDCDTLILRDPLPYLDGQVLQGRMAGRPTISHELFQVLFRHFGFSLPEPSYRCNPSGQKTIWYCNTGVLVFPRAVLDVLKPAWERFNQGLLDRKDLLPQAKYWFLDQASLALAFHAEPVPFQELPLDMNFPVTVPPEGVREARGAEDPVILHHHHWIDANGHMLSGPFPACQQRVAAFNRRLDQDRQQHFSARLYWDFWYAHAEGPLAGHKTYPGLALQREVLNGLLKECQPQTVLDVGCGDAPLVENLQSLAYTGLDISPEIIRKNQKAYPGRKFICQDAAEGELPSAELCLCLDTLPYIANSQRYHQLISRLLAATAKVGLVSGFESPPPGSMSPTCFHEPLSTSLRQAGAKRLCKVGSYGPFTLWSFGPANRRQSLLSRFLRKARKLAG